jgi:hypothetical protein
VVSPSSSRFGTQPIVEGDFIFWTIPYGKTPTILVF